MINHLRNCKGLIIFVALLAALVFSVAIAAPVLHLYHQTRAGRLMDGALSSLNSNAQDQLICSLKPITGKGARTELELAISHLEIAQRYYSDDAYTNLMLGRAYCVAGEFDKAIKQLKAYTEDKPQNPLGKIELGFVYGALGELRNAKDAWDAAGLRSDDFLQVSEADRKNGAFDEAIVWEASAAILDKNTNGLVNDPFSDQTVIIERFSISQGWIPYSNNSVGDFFVNDGILTMKYVNVQNVRDSFSWAASMNVPIKGYDFLRIRLYGKEGTYVTVETVIDGARAREINYLPVPRKWDILSIPLTGVNLDGITIGIGEIATDATDPKYELHIDWIGIQ